MQYCKSLRTWGKFAEVSNLLAVDGKGKGHRHHRHTEERQETRRPGDTQLLVHLHREQGETRAGQGAHEGVCRDRTVRVAGIQVDQVGDALDEDHDQTHPDRDPGQHLGYPRDVRRTGPRKPEKARREYETADDHGRQTVLGYDVPSLLQLAHVPDLGYDSHCDDP